MHRVLFAAVVGLTGVAVLIALGVWQLQRMAWKHDVIARIEARIAGAPDALPATPDRRRDAYMPVRLTGRFTGQRLRVLTSEREIGPGYRIIEAFVTDDGRRVLVDRGIVAESAAPQDVPGEVTVVGNLHWPQESDRFTPAPDAERDIWFARDVAAMARALGTEPVMVIQRDRLPGIARPAPRPVDTAAIPDNHLQYALTWFGLALVWTAMTGLFLWRTRAQAKGSRS